MCELSPITGCHAPATDRHHRKLQSAGGPDTRANTVHLCNPDHIHTVHGNPAWARHVGVIVSGHAPNPTERWQLEDWMTAP